MYKKIILQKYYYKVKQSPTFKNKNIFLNWNFFFFFRIFYFFLSNRNIFCILPKNIINFNLLNKFNLKKFFYNINSYKIINSLLLGSFLKQGQKIKTLNLLFSYFKDLFYFENIYQHNLNKIINTTDGVVLKTFFKNNTAFFNINFLISWAISFLHMQFNFKCKAVPKKFKKKIKKNFIMVVEYIYIKNRAKNTLKFIFSILKLTSKWEKIYKKSLFLFKLFFMYKNSFFYKYKIKSLQNFLKIKS